MDRIKCQQCGAESYHEFGKTALVCMTCYKKLQKENEQLKLQIRELKRLIETATN